ncbi:hypothetical protein J1614_001038 [Plenodomus biglobosus]|nr:hypothetical protein J1614_001038 [Plenodomus biglobosus]
MTSTSIWMAWCADQVLQQVKKRDGFLHSQTSISTDLQVRDTASITAYYAYCRNVNQQDKTAKVALFGLTFRRKKDRVLVQIHD